MTIRARLTLWYAGILIASLFVMGFGVYVEISEQLRHSHRREPAEHALSEAGEMIFHVGLPAVLLGLLGGWWLTRRALAPVTELTAAAEKIHAGNLAQKLPRTGNGDELDRLTEVFNAMTARLDGSFQRIREFTLHASHELKTPLTVMHGELETELSKPHLPAARREHLASQLDEVQRLTKIVDGLTLLTKADAGQIALKSEPVALDDIVRDVFADAQVLGKPTNLSVTLAACEEIKISGDKHRLRQLLLNLADNAVKYNQPGGTIEFSLQRDGAQAELKISNAGKTIPPEILPRVFERFFRGDPAHNSTVDGCGLGLSIAQWIVSAHNGTVKIESEPMKLTTVTVRLPVVESKS